MLESLLIKNFRSLEHLEVPKLGRVNLLVGKNNAGKSTVLEALRIYAGNANRALLEAIALGHDERNGAQKDEFADSESGAPFRDFFTGRELPKTSEIAIEIGELADSSSRLKIRHFLLEEVDEIVELDNGDVTLRRRKTLAEPFGAGDIERQWQRVLTVEKGPRSLPTLRLTGGRMHRVELAIGATEAKQSLACSVVPTKFISMNELARAWDAIALTEEEEVVKQALRIISPELESLVFVRAENGYRPESTTEARMAMVKLLGTMRPVPLTSMGDGMLRLLQLALKLTTAKGGFLLIDEFENGLHYSVQEKVWALIFEVAERLNIQVFATTHSWDCIESFTKVAVDREQTDGVLFRLGRSARASDQGRVIATVFDEAALQNITQADVEVR